MTARGLILRLKAIREPELRRIHLAGLLEAGDPAVWVEVLDALIGLAARTDDADAQAIVECLTQAVAVPRLSYRAREALYTEARQVGRGAVARLFLDASPATANARELERALEPERPLQPRGRPLTLGERKAAARTSRRDILIALVRDPHPDVVAVLLDNPHLTERDVVAIAALRPAAPPALVKVAEHPRWSTRYLVKRAVVLNPYTPANVAIRISTTLRRLDLAAIAADVNLPDVLRLHAAELLAAARRPARGDG
ncbi:MAG: hypothetical protein H6708_05790 [Kofleriaceae bacterium]|nr:hypothetical protein [Kofleriaceae bacterium]